MDLRENLALPGAVRWRQDPLASQRGGCGPGRGLTRAAASYRVLLDTLELMVRRGAG
ncbi:MAG: hypothetical protein QOG44_195, partial [Acidimicrobiaceae bacterium]|nr:hypothetical protein [Acidimicrobiaceae bacterium]